jgi:hypothetical protein
MTPEEKERFMADWLWRQDLERDMDDQRIKAYVREVLEERLERERAIYRGRDDARERMLAQIRWLLWVVAVVSGALLLHRLLIWPS